MPQSAIPANGNRALTRRQILGAAGAAVASAVPAAPAARAALPDPAVAALAQKFADALATCTAAERHRDDCERRYLEDGPMPPAALTRSGPLGKGLTDTQWWDVDDLALLLTDRSTASTAPTSPGPSGAASHCIRMLNQDVIDLYERTPMGAKVVVLGARAG